MLLFFLSWSTNWKINEKSNVRVCVRVSGRAMMKDVNTQTTEEEKIEPKQLMFTVSPSLSHCLVLHLFFFFFQMPNCLTQITSDWSRQVDILSIGYTG